MSSITTFAAVNTKINTMHSKLLSLEEFEKLLSLEQTESIIEFLDERFQTEGALQKASSFGKIEFSLELRCLEQMKKLRHYFKGVYLDFFDALLLKYEISDIKLILRKLQRGEGVDLQRDSFFVLDSHPELWPKENVSIASYVEQLKATRYYRVLQAYEVENPKNILFYMEMSLDRLYYQNIMILSKKLSKEDQNFARELIGRRMDLLNIIWIYRGIKNFHLISPEIYNFVMMGSDLLNMDEIKELCYADSVEEMAEKVREGPYAFLMDSSQDIDLYMNRRSNRYIYYLSLNEYRKSKFDIRKVLTYNYLLNFEARDLISILEGKRFGLASKEIKKFLIRKLEGSDDTWQ